MINIGYCDHFAFNSKLSVGKLCGNYSEMKLVQNGVEGRRENLKFRSGCQCPLHILSCLFHVVVWAKTTTNVQIRITHVQYKGAIMFLHMKWTVLCLQSTSSFCGSTDCQKLDNCRSTFSNKSLFGKSPAVKFLWP